MKISFDSLETSNEKKYEAYFSTAALLFWLLGEVFLCCVNFRGTRVLFYLFVQVMAHVKSTWITMYINQTITSTLPSVASDDFFASNLLPLTTDYNVLSHVCPSICKCSVKGPGRCPHWRFS